MPIEISIDPEEVRAAMERLKHVPYGLQKAVYPAVAEVMQGVRDKLTGYLSSDVSLSPQTVRRSIKLNPPRLSCNVVLGEVVVRSALVPLIAYDVQPGEVTARKGLHPRQWPDFTYSLRKGERRAGRSRVQGAGLPFIARMPKGHLGVYYRTGRQSKYGKAQIKEAYGPRVQYHVATPEVESVFKDLATASFPGILARYVDQALKNHEGPAS